jgi:hypothetical protein
VCLLTYEVVSCDGEVISSVGELNIEKCERAPIFSLYPARFGPPTSPRSLLTALRALRALLTLLAPPLLRLCLCSIR